MVFLSDMESSRERLERRGVKGQVGDAEKTKASRHGVKSAESEPNLFGAGCEAKRRGESHLLQRARSVECLF